jgi:DNA repair exonuclease SbcCD nuclease subunit
MKRAWLISDLHFGMRSNSMEWLDIQTDYFYNWFIPTVKKYVLKDDSLFILGDIFDNRQNVQLLVQHTVIKLMEDLSQIFPKIYILVGNHDIYRKHSNEVTSLDCLKYIPNITIFKKPFTEKIQGKTCFFVPWRKNKEHEFETYEKQKHADYVFCHSEVYGVKMNSKVKNDAGNDIKIFEKFGKVYSGHIHYSQKLKNFTLIGNPYEMTRSDAGNKKGIYLIDFENDTELFIENTYSPKFMKLNITSIYDKKISDLKKMFDGNFIDLYVSSNIISKYDVGKLLSILDSSARRIEPQIYEEEDNMEYDNETEYKSFNLMDMTEIYIKNKGYEKETGEKIKKEIKNLLEEHQKI